MHRTICKVNTDQAKGKVDIYALITFSYSKYSCLISFTNVVPCILDTVRGSLVSAWLFDIYFFYFLLFTI